MKESAVITMEKGGEIKFDFFPEDAPKTVENFVTLARKGFYDGLTFHRVEPGFVVQGGDPQGNGIGGPGYKIKAEFNKQKHVRGAVAMARSNDPDSAGSQFYIVLAPRQLPRRQVHGLRHGHLRHGRGRQGPGRRQDEVGEDRRRAGPVAPIPGGPAVGRE